MINELVQFRVDKELKDECAMLCKELGMTLSVYLRLCMKRMVKEKQIPFKMKTQEKKKAEIQQ